MIVGRRGLPIGSIIFEEMKYRSAGKCRRSVIPGSAPRVCWNFSSGKSPAPAAS